MRGGAIDASLMALLLQKATQALQLQPDGRESDEEVAFHAARALSRRPAVSDVDGIASALAAGVDAALQRLAETRHRPPPPVTSVWHDALSEAQDAVGGRRA